MCNNFIVLEENAYILISFKLSLCDFSYFLQQFPSV